MKQLIIICEGPTEQEFCKDVLSNHFYHYDILVSYPTIKASNGGIVKWATLKKQIGNHLKHEKSAIVTTLIDYYGILEKHSFPNFSNSQRYDSIADKISEIETGMKQDISSDLNFRFIPYIQLHEFECFLFNTIEVFTNNFESSEANFKKIKKDIDENPNPELINNNRETAPSKRLGKYIPGYSKIVYGACLASEIGIKNIRLKCPRFNDWINSLEKI